jgi:hypothetical protein
VSERVIVSVCLYACMDVHTYAYKYDIYTRDIQVRYRLSGAATKEGALLGEFLVFVQQLFTQLTNLDRDVVSVRF